MADQPAADPAAPPAGASTDDRITALEETQKTQDGKLDKILGLLEGKPAAAAAAAPVTSAEPPPGPDIAEQVRQAVRQVAAEQAPAKPEPKPEVRPREAGQPRRERLQGIMFGRDPKK